MPKCLALVPAYSDLHPSFAHPCPPCSYVTPVAMPALQLCPPCSCAPLALGTGAALFSAEFGSGAQGLREGPAQEVTPGCCEVMGRPRGGSCASTFPPGALCPLNPPGACAPTLHPGTVCGPRAPRSPYVAGLGLAHHQQVTVHFVHELGCDPAQRHPQLVSGDQVVLLRADRVSPGQYPLPACPPPPTYSVFAVCQAVVPDLHCQVRRKQAVPQGQVTVERRRGAQQSGGLGPAHGEPRPMPLPSTEVTGSA